MKCIDYIHFINIGVVVNGYYAPFIRKDMAPCSVYIMNTKLTVMATQ